MTIALTGPFGITRGTSSPTDATTLQQEANRILSETACPLRKAAKFFPLGRNDRPTHVSTLLRWILHGTKDGVRLEAIRVGGRWVTSREACERFSARLTAIHGNATAAADPIAAPNASGPNENGHDYDQRLDHALAAYGL
jgi:hypothetical protein